MKGIPKFGDGAVLSICWNIRCRRKSYWRLMTSSFRHFTSEPKMLNGEIYLADITHGFVMRRKGPQNLWKFKNLEFISSFSSISKLVKHFAWILSPVFSLTNISYHGKPVKSLI
jgi:hypothetical protein